MSQASASFYLGQRHFTIALSIALAVHLAVLVAYMIAPREAVEIIPVRALNLKLGSGDEVGLGDMAEEETNSQMVEQSLGQLLSQPSSGSRRALNTLERVIAEKASKFAQAGKPVTESVKTVRGPQQFVRERDTRAVPQQAGSSLGTGAESEAEVLARYEQAISAWIQRFKMYPTEARAANLAGDALVRVRIDRRGTIRYTALETTTGQVALDRAALEMVRRANPVPPVPDNYPAGELIEFLIPVSFRLQ